MTAPLVLINAVGLTPRLLPHAPRLAALGWMRPLKETIPAVTCTAQASILTGKPPSGHGIVANGWLFRDTGEVRFWQQSNRLIEAEPIYRTLKLKCAKLFWWFNQGADVALSVTPKPWYGADGSKAFGITGTPSELPAKLEKEWGAFPFHTFWGPMAGAGCTAWIARAGASVLRDERPDFSLVYLPHLDYDPQRFGPQGCDLPKLVKELDDACLPLLEEAKRQGARVWVVSEYGHLQVSQPLYPNRILRQAGLLDVRDGPFGETLETFTSRAFAVCDHQLAHVYVRKKEDIPRVRELLSVPGVAQVLEGEARGGLDHPRSGELVLLSDPDAWFAYPFWVDDRRAPDYARTVDIHRKPGYDPCELFFDPKKWWPKLRAGWKLLKKKLGFRILMDLIPLDASLVRGSHGVAAPDPLDRPLLIGDGIEPGDGLGMEDVHRLLVEALR